MSLKWNAKLARNITGSPEIAGPAGRVLLDYGWQIAARAAAYARKDTGEGAKSIHPEMIMLPDGSPEVHVSWDRQHFYMGFQELGTEQITPWPALRRAATELVG